MASPTRPEIEAQIGRIVGFVQKVRATASIDVDNLLTRYDAIVDGMETNYPAEVASAMAGERAGVDALLTNASSMMDPMLREYGSFIDSPNNNTNDIISDIYDYMVANSFTVKSRDFTFGTPAAGGSNVGDGVLSRLNVDAAGFKIENVFAEAKTFRCSQDSAQGASQHEEFFEARGEDSNRDTLLVSGSGAKNTIRALSGRDSYLANSSFSSIEGTDGAPTGITYWTPGGNISNFQGDATNYYRGYAGEATPKAIKFMADDYLEQKMSVRGAAFDEAVPMYLQLAYNKDIGTVSGGTLTLALGSQSVSVGLASGTGWQILRLPAGTGNWFKNFNNGDPAVRITVSGIGAGSYLLVDDVILAPYFRFAGNWVFLTGGATRFQLGDTITYTDTCAETGILQHWFFRARGRYLPHTTGGPTWADPT